MNATFRTVKAEILDKITQGIWQPGALLPTETELAKTYDCARATVNRAMRELANEGILERKRKAGTRVRMSPVRSAKFEIPIVRREIEGKGQIYRYALVRQETVKTPDWLRARLALKNGQEVVHLVCMHYANGNPYQFEDRWINAAALPQVQDVDFSDVGPNEWLVETVPFSDVEISFSATQADEELSNHLSCSKGDALFMAERSTWWENNAITYVRLYFQRGHRITTRY